MAATGGTQMMFGNVSTVRNHPDKEISEMTSPAPGF
jgi:hypothetical protein